MFKFFIGVITLATTLVYADELCKNKKEFDSCNDGKICYNPTIDPNEEFGAPARECGADGSKCECTEQ